LLDKVVVVFNELNQQALANLKREVNGLPRTRELKYCPVFMSDEVGDELAERFENGYRIPTLFFWDPWGYKGLTKRLLSAVLRNWGCDCIFFFNYNAINRHLSFVPFYERLKLLFGNARLQEMANNLQDMTAVERRAEIIRQFGEAINDLGFNRPLCFTFKNEGGVRVTHYLMFMSKHALGYRLMKQVMKNYSSSAHQGVPSFEHDPYILKMGAPLLDPLSPLEELKKMLVDKFKDKTLTYVEMMARLSPEVPYVDENLQEACRQLEQEGLIKCDKPANKRTRKGVVTFGKKVKATFV